MDDTPSVLARALETVSAFESVSLLVSKPDTEARRVTITSAETAVTVAFVTVAPVLLLITEDTAAATVVVLVVDVASKTVFERDIDTVLDICRRASAICRLLVEVEHVHVAIVLSGHAAPVAEVQSPSSAVAEVSVTSKESKLVSVVVTWIVDVEASSAVMSADTVLTAAVATASVLVDESTLGSLMLTDWVVVNTTGI